MRMFTIKDVLKGVCGIVIGLSMLGGHIKFFVLGIAALLLLTGLVENRNIKIKKSFGITTGKKKADTMFSLMFGLVWFLWAVLSVLWAENIQRVIYQLEFFVIALVVGCILFYYIKCDKDLLILIKCSCFIALLNNLLAWMEIISGTYLFLDNPVKVQLYQSIGMPATFFDNANDLATYLSIMIFFALICYKASDNIICKGYYLLLVLSNVLIILRAGSKANLIGLLLAFGVTIIYNIKNRKMLLLYCVGSGLVLVYLILNIEIWDEIINTISGLLVHQYRAPGSSYSVRINLILNSFVAMKDTFGLGVGAGNSQIYMMNHFYHNVYGTYALHNFWLEILVDYGVIITILFVVFYLALTFKFWKNAIRNKCTLNGIISIGFSCCLVEFCMGSLSSSSNLQSIWVWVMFVLFVLHQRNINDEVSA